jgi:hypothetical protein
MQAQLTDKEVKGMLERLKEDLNVFKEDTRALEYVFESAAKHMPVYLKIIKGHIEQLAKVLGLETHNHRNLENAGLAKPVIQLIQLFQALDDEDIHLLENLASESQNWSTESEVSKLSNTEFSGVATEV